MLGTAAAVWPCIRWGRTSREVMAKAHLPPSSALARWGLSKPWQHAAQATNLRPKASLGGATHQTPGLRGGAWRPRSHWAGSWRLDKAFELQARLPLRMRRHLVATSAAAPTESAAPPVATGKQPMDYTTLVACVAELNCDWVPAKVEQALQVDAFTLVLRLRTMEKSGWLYISRHETGCHMAVGDTPARGSAAEAFSFGEQVQGQVRGLVLLSASVPYKWERIARLDLAARINDPPSRQIFFEATGRYSNIVLTDDCATVLTAAFQVGSKMSSVRAIRAGDTYTPPPEPPGIPPDPNVPARDWKEDFMAVAAGLAEKRQRPAMVAETLVRGWQGVSPSLAQELCMKAGFAADTLVLELQAEHWASLSNAWEAWLEALEAQSFTPSVCVESGSYSVLGAFPDAAPANSLHALLRGYYAPVQGGRQFDQLRSAVTSALNGAIKKTNNKIAQLSKQMGSAEQNADLQKLGDLLMANLHRCEPGVSSIDVEDWDTGQTITITLDPRQTAVQCAEGFYKKGGKMRRSVNQVTPLLEKSRAELEYLQEIEVSVSQLGEYSEDEDLYTLLEIRDELVAGRFMRPPPETALEDRGAAKGRRALKKGQAKRTQGTPREFVSPSGFKILVGRNNRQNDALSRSASDQDLWLHARGVPGSHVIVKVPPGSEPRAGDREYAANLAAFFSKARTSGRVDVICVEASNVKRPKGASPGQVILLREKVIVGRPDDCPAASAGDS